MFGDRYRANRVVKLSFAICFLPLHLFAQIPPLPSLEESARSPVAHTVQWGRDLVYGDSKANTSIVDRDGDLADHEPQAAKSSSHASTPAFDVASIRPSNPNNQGFSVQPNSNIFIERGASLKFLIQYAFRVEDFQIGGAPAWSQSARYGITAKMEGISSGVTLPGDDDDNWVAGQRLMEARLRSLLVGRFELRTHMDTKDMQAFSLIISGTSARRNSSTKDDGYSAGRGALRCTSTSMADLEGILSSVLGKPLFDRTGLSGSYQFILRWAGDDIPAPGRTLPEIFSAIQEQLGLRLIPQKQHVSAVVIDYGKKPSDN